MAPKQQTPAKIGPLGRNFAACNRKAPTPPTLLWQALKESLVKFVRAPRFAIP